MSLLPALPGKSIFHITIMKAMVLLLQRSIKRDGLGTIRVLKRRRSGSVMVLVMLRYK